MYQGHTDIFYVFDKDESTLDFRDAQFIEEVEQYCKNQNYKLIWFVKNIEHVMHRCLIPQKIRSENLINLNEIA